VSTTPARTTPASTTALRTDPHDARLARSATGLLAWFNEAGILDVADVHVARRLGTIGGTDDDTVLLAAALATRAPRLGHVCVDLATISATAGTEEGETPPELPWPDPSPWCATLAASPLVGEGRPLRLDGTRLYLERLHAEECRVATALLARAAGSVHPVGTVDDQVLADGLARLFPDDGAGTLQAVAAEAAVRGAVTVVAGGPGTGKTTTVARVLVLLEDQARAVGARPPLVALAAPTGRAAARLEEAVRQELDRLDLVIEGSKERWTASTLHRLLGSRPDSTTRFRHDRNHPLVHDVVVVDEASMLSLSLMDRLVDAVRPEARLVLLGDPEQLASVEAGVVLGDVVAAATGIAPHPPEDGAPSGPMDRRVVTLQRTHRFGGAIAALAAAVRDGDADRTLELLRAGDDQLAWIDAPAGEMPEHDLATTRAAAVAAWTTVTERATAGDAAGALEARTGFQVLCTHRHGPAGAVRWSERLEAWMAEAWMAGGLPAEGLPAGDEQGHAPRRQGRWHVGQPLLVTVNDYDLQLFNGDTGVVVTTGAGRLAAAFEREGGIAALSPGRLSHVEPCYAMTIHKAQGSQFDAAAVVLADPGSRILTRELLYTAITRARRHVTVIGTPDSVTAAVERPITRASGLQDRLRDRLGGQQGNRPGPGTSDAIPGQARFIKQNPSSR